VALPAFAAVRHAAGLLLQPGPQQQTRSSGVWQTDVTEGQTDVQQMHRPCSAYNAGSANTLNK